MTKIIYFIFCTFLLFSCFGEKENSYINGFSFTKDELKNECEKIVEGKKSDAIEKTELYTLYQSTILNIENKSTTNNDYLDFLNINNGNCEYFSNQENSDICNIVKTKDLIGLEKILENNMFEYTLVKSMILETNMCHTLTGAMDNKECNTYINDYININEISVGDLIGGSAVQVGKVFTEIGREKFLKKINSEFLGKCNLL